MTEFLAFSILWAWYGYSKAKKHGRDLVIGTLSTIAFGLFAALYWWYRDSKAAKNLTTTV